MSWTKLKSMFVVTDDTHAAPSTSPDDVLRELEKYQLPPEAAPQPLPPEMAGITFGARAADGAGEELESGAGAIDFQALYDRAGVPNTDEVEALERFLAGLDTSLPESSKVAAAKAFLGAIGKAPGDVITDAGRKIEITRAVLETKRGEVDGLVRQRQARIAELQKEIDGERSAIEAVQKELESVKAQCAIEEARLQGARMFFGHVPGLPHR